MDISKSNSGIRSLTLGTGTRESVRAKNFTYLISKILDISRIVSFGAYTPGNSGLIFFAIISSVMPILFILSRYDPA